MNILLFGNNLDKLKSIDSNSIDLIYIDPPFNTGKIQSRLETKMIASEDGDRVGYKGKRYKTEIIGKKSYNDTFGDYSDYYNFLRPRLEEAYRVLKPYGSFYFHIDYREVHYCKIMLDSIFGRECFQNEIIWAYDYGARSTKKWSAKHDNILFYTKHKSIYTFNNDAIDRIPYMAPGLVGKEKAARGKTPTDTWWHTIVSPTGREKTGYPTQKPLGILERIVLASSNKGDVCLDFFAGSGSFGEACSRLGRDCILIDSNQEAIDVIKKRLSKYNIEVVDIFCSSFMSDKCVL